MRIFNDAVQMIKEVERDLFEMGTRYQSATVQDKEVKNDPNFQTIELCGYAYMLTDFSAINIPEVAFYSGYLQGKEDWLFNESRERLGMLANSPSKNPGIAWTKNLELWKPFLRDGFFSYTYAERWLEQIPYIIKELLRRPNSRQAIMTMYDRHQDMMNWGGRDRVPCSLTYQFLIREDRLVCIYNQRSCDFVKFFGADVYFTIQLMRHIATRTGLELGQFIHFIGSLHAFAGDLKDREIF